MNRRGLLWVVIPGALLLSLVLLSWAGLLPRPRLAATGGGVERPEGKHVFMVHPAARPEEGPAPLTVKFFNVTTSPQPVTETTWDFGDGNSAPGEGERYEAEHTYSQPGVYLAVVRAISQKGQKDGAIVPVIVLPPSGARPAGPRIDFSELTVDHKEVSGMTRVNVRISEGVVKVEYYLSGELIETVNRPPFSLRWDTRSLQNGMYWLTAVAYDREGVPGVAQRMIVVNNR